MKNTPSIDNFFDLGKALQEDGFEIDNKENSSIAFGFSYGKYGKIWIEFNLAFLDNDHKMPIDMRVFHIKDNFQENLFKGLAPTCQEDYDKLIQLLFPTKEYVDRIESNLFEQERLAAFDNSIPYN